MSIKFYVILFIISIRLLLELTGVNSLVQNRSNFNYLVLDGYRPNTHTLPKSLVSLRRYEHNIFFGDNHFCGGSIYKPHVVITAAHCVVKSNKIIKPETIYIVAGTNNRLEETATTQIIGVRKIIPYPNYSPLFITNDIALLILWDDIKIDDKTTATVNLVDKRMPPGTKCTTLGWGTIFEKGPLAAEVLYADINLWRYEKCRWSLGTFARGMICGKNPSEDEVDTCQGDSGGPLLCNFTLTGIVSWGYSCGLSTPGVYTDVWRYIKWIKENKATALIAKQQLCFWWMLAFNLIMTQNGN